MAEGAGMETGVVRIKRQRQSAVLMRRLAKNPTAMIGLVLFMIMVIIAVFAQQIATHPYQEQHIEDRLQGPSSEHIFGTDELGRDLFSRIVYGARYSLSIGVLAVLLGALVGLVFGAIAGYFGGKSDGIVMRVTDVLQSIPGKLLAMILSVVLGPGFMNTMIALTVGNIPMSVRLMRAGILGIRHQEYLEAALSINASKKRIIFRHVLPNSFSPLLVSATMSVGNTIMMSAMLSFIGLGIQPPLPEWGALIAGGQGYILHGHLSGMIIFPGLFIMITVLSLNMFGDGLRDVLDPKLKH